MDETTILIVEDDRDTGRYLKRILNKAGYDVIVARTGNKAWEILQGENAPKLAILDWMIPGMSGVELCRKLRATNENIRTYVIMVTARGNKQDIITGLDAGADDYIVKPIDRGEFLARLGVAKRALDLQRRLVQRIDDQELLLRHHNLFDGTVPEPAISSKTAGSAQSVNRRGGTTANGFSRRVNALRTVANIDVIFMNRLQEMGVDWVNLKTSTSLEGVQNSVFAGWSALFLRPKAVWLVSE